MDKPSTSSARDDVDPERRKSVRFAPKPEESEAKSSSENEDESGEDSDAESSEESSSDESVELPPPLAPNRSRRHNAGNRYFKVLAEEENKAEGDEVYETLYGGFKEVEDDANFEADSDEGSDEENVELDEEEERGEDAAADEKQGEGEEDLDDSRKKKKKVAPRKKPSWLMSQMSEETVPENALSKRDQEHRLKECKAIAAENRRSLAEMLKKQREEKEKQKIKPRARYLQGPKESYYSDAAKTYLLKPSLKQWKEAKVENKVCSVSGKPAKYCDPVSGHYFFGPKEFKEIRNTPSKYPKLRRARKSEENNVANGVESKSITYPSSWNPPRLVNDQEEETSIGEAVTNTLIWMHSKSQGQSTSPPSTKELQVFRDLVDDRSRPRKLQSPPSTPDTHPNNSPKPVITKLNPTIRRPIYIIKPQGLSSGEICPQRISPRGIRRLNIISPAGPEAKIPKLG